VRQRRPGLNPALYVGRQRYFFTFCTAHRRAHFNEPTFVETALDRILRCAATLDMAILAYSFMPDHLHLLVEGCTDTSDALQFVHQAKQHTGYAFSCASGTRVWQPSFHDSILTDEDATFAVERYILENPARAGLAESRQMYRSPERSCSPNGSPKGLRYFPYPGR
jgi:putative transposase